MIHIVLLLLTAFDLRRYSS